MDLTFGEQVKIILSRKGMTIKELAETIEERTGRKMSRQNLTQRLGRDNFQEQDMRMIADILGCPFKLSILEESDNPEKPSYYKKEEKKKQAEANSDTPERDITIGELVEIHEELDALIEEETGDLPPLDAPVEELLEEVAALEAESREKQKERQEQEEARRAHGWMSYLQRRKKKADLKDKKAEPDKDTEDAGARGMREIYAEAEALAEESEYIDGVGEAEADTDYAESDAYENYDIAEEEKAYTEPEEEPYEKVYEEEDRVNGDVNPYTGREYMTNSVRMHPNRIGYVQVYDRQEHAWTDMTEWAFLGYQERKKALLGKDYEPPIYLD